MALATRGGATVYGAGSVARRDARWGLSDVDLVVVGHEPGLRRARRRWRRIRTWLPPLGGLVSDLWTYEQSELDRCAGRTYRDVGLASDGIDDAAAYFGPDPLQDRMGILERPGLDGSAGWRRLAGVERRPSPPAAEPLLAGWLELQYWWRRALEVAVGPRHHASARLSVRVTLEPARVYLRLVHGLETSDGRAVWVVRDRLPEDALDAVERALWLDRSLREMTWTPLSERCCEVPYPCSSDRRAALDTQVFESGATDVALLHATEHESASVALADWRALVVPSVDWSEPMLPRVVVERIAEVGGDPAHPRLLVTLARASHPRRRVALRSGGLLIVPVTDPWSAGRFRILKTASFLIRLASRCWMVAGARRFPPCARSTWRALARRAVAEHRGWLACEHGGEGIGPEWLGARPGPGALNAAAISLLMSAARAALLAESLDRGEPELPVSDAATANAIANREPRARAALDEALACCEGGFRPDPATVNALRDAVARMPGLAAAQVGRAP